MLALAHGIHHVYTTLLPLFYPIFGTEFNLTYAELGLLGTAFIMIFSALQFPTSFLYKYVKRKILVGICMIWMGITTFFTGTSTGYSQILAWQGVEGVGASLYHPIGTSFISERFKEGRGRAMGVHMTGGNIGTSLAPLAGGFLIAYLGWRNTLYLFLLPGAIAGVLFMLMVEETKHGSRETSTRKTGVSLWVAFRDPRVMAITAVGALTSFRFRAVTNFAPSYFVKVLGFDIAKAGVFFTVMLIAGAFSPVIFGYASDRFSRKPVIIVAVLSSALSIYLLTLASDIIAVVADLLFLGFTLYSSASVLQAFLADVADPAVRDVVFGLFFALEMTFGGIAPLVLGAIIDFWGFKTAFFATAALSALGAVVILPVRERSTLSH
jgi:MFS family permease